ncbi:MAG: ABC transporter substrate-binding protein [Thermomicrobiales bacterium]
MIPTQLRPVADDRLTAAEMERLIAAITRRRIVIGGAGAALLAGAPGIVRGQDASPEALREVHDLLGPVLVPAHPQRVIVEGNTTLGNMMALGMTPIAATFNPYSFPTFLANDVKDVLDIREAGTGTLDLEKTLSLNPDLIIAMWGSNGEAWNLENVERYKQVVPATYAYAADFMYEEQVKQNLIEVATALNLEERAAEVLAEFDHRVAELRQQVIATGFDEKPVTVVRVSDDGSLVIKVGTAESIVLQALGIPQPAGQQDPTEIVLDLSPERLDVLNEAWAVVLYVDDTATFTPETLLAGPLWQSLTPVQEGRVVFVSSGTWNALDILGIMAIMDDVEMKLLPLARAKQGLRPPGPSTA